MYNDVLSSIQYSSPRGIASIEYPSPKFATPFSPNYGRIYLILSELGSCYPNYYILVSCIYNLIMMDHGGDPK